MKEKSESKELIVLNEKALAEFELTPAQVAEIAKEYMHFTVPAGDKDAYRIARAALTVCVKARTGTDARRKDLGSEARSWLADISEAARALLEPLIPVEAHLKAEVYNEDSRMKEKKAEKAKKEFERVEEIRNKIKAIMELSGFVSQRTTSEDMHGSLAKAEAIEITEEEYMEFAFEAQRTKEATCADLTNAIEIREEFEAEEAARKAEDKRLAAERVEIDRLTAEQDERQRIIDEEQEKVDAEKNRLEQEKIEREASEKAAAEAEAITKKAQEDAKAKLEQEVREKEERESKEKKEREEKEAADRKAAEAAAAEKDERRPDKEKLDRWLDQMALVLFDHPEEGLKNLEAQKAFNVIYERLDGALKYSKNLIETL